MLVLPLPAAPPIFHLASCTNFSMLPLFSFSVCTPPPNKPITLPLILDNLCTPHLPVSHPDSILSPPPHSSSFNSGPQSGCHVDQPAYYYGNECERDEAAD